MPSLPPFAISPPLLNSSNPWATTREDLLALYDCPSTGAVTLRTSLWGGFPNDAAIHQYAFYSPATGHATVKTDVASVARRDVKPGAAGEMCSLNTLGYSPVSFEEYMNMLVGMSRDGSLLSRSGKPFIISVSGTADEVARCLSHILRLQNEPDSLYPPPSSSPEAAPAPLTLMMEINLSCPNIPDKPPPAYDGAALSEYITSIATVKKTCSEEHPDWTDVHVGIKTPPYTHAGEFKILITALDSSAPANEAGCPISFITATNTLGSCLVLDAHGAPALASANGTGIGGLAGEALHPLALGNVRTIRGLLDASVHPSVKDVRIIGIGGVADAAGWRRMRAVGAQAVGVGTALGREGVLVFGKIAEALGGEFV